MNSGSRTYTTPGDICPSHNGTIRCAIYTRKSTDEGLDQEFNSLDAQRESAEAFIRSQQHEGWVCQPDAYNDGGFTGGNMERPALKRLISDIERGEIDCVVVYKVDRLSRSLLDFSRIIGLFDKHGVSFVSVTQQFNTTSSMGRLTLNILLSFAQFEREIISERTRDKISAARKKGKWTGGMPVLGYDIDSQARRLVVNQEEAEQVRAVFDLYLDRQRLLSTVQELNRRDWRTKHWITKKGSERGGKPFTKNSLFRLLTNVIYTGKVRYKDSVYPGEHEQIISEDRWQQVRDLLRQNARSGGINIPSKHGAILRGLLYCVPCGTAMMHTYTAKKNRRYRYYVCLNAQQRGWSACPTKSINAHDIESFIVEHIHGIGCNQEIIAETIKRVRAKSETRLAELNREQRVQKKQLRRLHIRLRKLIGEPVGISIDSSTIDQLADLQDQIRSTEQRMTEIEEEIITLQREAVDEEEIARSLSAFTPVWKSLNSREQSRIIKLLIERIGYDGRDESVKVTFRSLGIKALCAEKNSSNEKESQ